MESWSLVCQLVLQSKYLVGGSCPLLQTKVFNCWYVDCAGASVPKPYVGDGRYKQLCFFFSPLVQSSLLDVVGQRSELLGYSMGDGCNIGSDVNRVFLYGVQGASAKPKKSREVQRFSLRLLFLPCRVVWWFLTSKFSFAELPSATP